MCIHQGHSFLINSSIPPGTTCNATTNDEIYLEQIVQHEFSDISSKTVYPSWDISVNGTNTTIQAQGIVVSQTGTATYMVKLDILNGTKYKLLRSYILVSGTPDSGVVMCEPALTSYGCKELDVSCAQKTCKFTC
jgi:hypothetical protein